MNKIWSDDAELFALAKRELFVAVVGDTLDTMGLRTQFLHPNLKPVDPGSIILGRAMPVLEADIETLGEPSADSPLAPPFGLMFSALDDLLPNEVYICSGSSHRYALWGGLMTTRALACGAAGAVVHGYHRDTKEILRLGLPVASFGSYAQETRGSAARSSIGAPRSRSMACRSWPAMLCMAISMGC